MSNLTVPKSGVLNEEPSAVSRKKLKGNPSELGRISETIGTGENAKNSIVWITIRWSLILGGSITVALFLTSFCGDKGPGTLIDDIKGVWSIFMPIVTLALGYTFGKGR